METGGEGRPPARRADASRNDKRILVTAREVFIELGPGAPISVIAERAGVGMGTLYRRYPSKEDLMRALSLAHMEQTRAAAEAGLADPDPWAGFEGFIVSCVEAGVDGSPRLAGTFEVTEDVLATSKRAREAITVLVTRAQAEGGLRRDVNADDIVVLLHALRERRSARGGTAADLTQRFLGIILDGLRASNARRLAAPPTDRKKMEQAMKSTFRKDAPHSP
ncbi:TetR/AcrR family transcriptional regulator [Protofrankia symbiont of Coriaria ruscifolia]|uniref:TetR/AcrR family transcriptional regulator n=1 Tax=Protofrankia symbiont of Coriaria ruscifolia TaxID=1306542 RepID=UPI00104154DE|nr:TetR/AcrR family transcriptional regulator [Protofrankia symbiont of Coriaria ruscifolia]